MSVLGVISNPNHTHRIFCRISNNFDCPSALQVDTVSMPRPSQPMRTTFGALPAAQAPRSRTGCENVCETFCALWSRVVPALYFSRLYMDGWRDGLNRLWRDGVTILPRPAKKIATAINNRPVPALEKKKNTAPSRPVEKKKKPPRPASEKNNNRPVPPRTKTTTALSRLEKKNKRRVAP